MRISVKENSTFISNEELLKKIFENVGIELSELQVERFNKYYFMLIETNKVMNLTAITEYKDVVIKHFADSLLVCKTTDINNYNTIIDVGTGAGFPGIPLKIIYPHLNITLLDSLNKRVKFLEKVVEEIGLENVKCIHGRAEDFGHDINYREKYDVCVSRAVANLSTLSEYCTPFVKVGGRFISYKSADVEDEVNSAKTAIKILNCKIEKVSEVSLPGTADTVRKFVIVKKEDNIPKKYPRKSGVPSKTPLG